MSDIASLKSELLGAVSAATSLDALEAARIDALGKKGKLTALMKTLGTMEAEARKAYGSWIMDEKKLARGHDAIFLHCLPTRRDVEIAAEVLDGPRSVVIDEAENRLWTAMAVLLRVLQGSVVSTRERSPGGPLLA